MIVRGTQWMVDLANNIAERLRTEGYRVNLVIDPQDELQPEPRHKSGLQSHMEGIQKMREEDPGALERLEML
jgi:hypothetical protein